MKFLQGRTNRASYWAGLVTLAIIMIALSMFMEKPPKVQEILLIFLAVPRLHDIGRSGWLALPPLILEVVGVIACVAYLPPESAQVAFGVIALVLAGLMILLGIVPGDPMPNRFGEPPPPGVGLSKMAGDQR